MIRNTLFAMYATGSVLCAQPGMLRVNDVDNPVGTGDSIYFGWMLNEEGRDQIQSSYQIIVSSTAEKLADDQGDVWDSGTVTSPMQNHVAYQGPSLQSDRRYYWKVRTWDRDGTAGSWSETATFDTGLFTNDDWAGANWIRRDTKDPDDYTMFRHKSSLPPKEITRATAYIAACHKYELYLNGTLVGKGPAYHHPQYHYYNAFDITATLRPGSDNQFAVFHRWFGGGQGRPAGARGLIMKAVVHHRDGSTSVIGTDARWKQSRAQAWVPDDLVSRNRGEGVGYVERIDGRLLLPDWNLLTFDDSSWQAADVIGRHPVAPWTGTLAPDLTRIVETPIAPASITAKGGGTYVIDLGRLYAGIPRIRFKGGTPGTVVSMRGGDVLDSDGKIPRGTKSQSTDMEFRAILSGGPFVFEPKEYLGMRWFQIDNAPMTITRENFSFIKRHTVMDEEASSFESSDATLNAVWNMMKHSLFTCAQEEFVDTPTREKGGFLGDAAIQSTVAMPVLHERSLTRRALGQFLQSMDQHWSSPADLGRMNAVYPNNDGGRDIPDFTLAYLPWVWSYYMETGDRAFMESSWEKLHQIGGYIARHTDPATGLVTKLTGGSGPYEHGIIDWPATMRFGYDMDTSARTVINAWAYAGYEHLARIAGELGKAGERQDYQHKAAAIGKAIHSHLANTSGIYSDGLHADGQPSARASQHANMFPLALGIVPEANRAAVIEHVKSKGMSVGMVTVMWLVRALGEAEEGSALFDLYTNHNQPGWARCLKRGATATWESWDADTTGQSMSHAWGAAGLEGYTRYVLGIRPLKPQYEEVLIRPLDFGDKLEWAGGKITTDRGEIHVHWSRGKDSYSLAVEVPPNVTAQIHLPRGPSSHPSVQINGRPLSAVRENNHLVISGVGAGVHKITRKDG